MRDYYTKEELRWKLPKVGDRRIEVPTVDETPGINQPKRPRRCEVVYVNPANLWYTVQFENGIRESYKLPRLTPVGGGGRV